MSKNKIKFNSRTITALGLLTALEIILSRFLSISVWDLKIGLGFIPVVLAAILFDPLQAGIVGALADFLGATLFPIGPYFPGFTLTAFLMGIVFGVFLRGRQVTVKVFLAVCINQLILSLLLNSLWISILYDTSFLSLIPSRIIQTAILIPVQITLTMILSKTLQKTYLKRVAA